MSCEYCPIPGTRCDACDPPPPRPPGMSASEAALRAGRLWDALGGLTGDQAGLVVVELMARLAAMAAAPPDALDRLHARARQRLALWVAGRP